MHQNAKQRDGKGGDKIKNEKNSKRKDGKACARLLVLIFLSCQHHQPVETTVIQRQKSYPGIMNTTEAEKKH